MNPRHDPLDHEERALARLLPGDDAVAPDAAVDARILAAARDSLGVPPAAGRAPHRSGAARRPRRGWPVALGLAASVTLAVGVAWQLREPPLPAIAPATAPSAKPAGDAAQAPVARAPAPAATAPAMAATDAEAGPAPAEHDAAVAAAGARTTQRQEKAGRQAEAAAAAAVADAGADAHSEDTQAATAAAMQRPAQRQEKAGRQAEALAASEAERARAHQAATAAAVQRSTQRTGKAARQAMASPPPPAAPPAPMAEPRATAVSQQPSPPAPPAPPSVLAAPAPAAAGARPDEHGGGFAPDPPVAVAAEASDLSITAAANVVGDDARLPPSQWLQRIRERSGRGETALARASLARFLQVHPQEPVPADLRPLLP